MGWGLIDQDIKSLARHGRASRAGRALRQTAAAPGQPDTFELLDHDGCGPGAERRFAAIAITHEMANNLGTQAAETSGSLSTCWITESVWKEINANPTAARELWRGKLAVRPDWNQNGTYVKFTYNKARDGDITVWEGPTAMQWLGRDGEEAEGFLEGGLTQVVWQPRAGRPG